MMPEASDAGNGRMTGRIEPLKDVRPATEPLPPGSVIGILGGGQLGRMLAMAAARLGYRCHVLATDAGQPAVQVTNLATIADFEDLAALDRFAAAVDVATYEFENLPFATVAHLKGRIPLRPGADVLAVCQDRIREKAFFTRVGAPVPPHAAVHDARTLAAALARIGRPAVLKSTRFGYDGKGQVRIDATTEPADAWARIAERGGRTADTAPAILEAWVDFAMEVSVIVARGADGAMTSYVPVQNVHENHILRRTIAPAPLSAHQRSEASHLARRLAEAIGLVGVLAVEMFLTREGRYLVNELAPRPHNSGHWTLDACATSQFEQCVRAVCGLPLGPVERCADAVMDNLLGHEIERWPALAAEPGARLHLYGKAGIRPGRKVGHVTRLTAKTAAD
jgi:5-(carboxyamino)imidazole ribonucleotide synthase